MPEKACVGSPNQNTNKTSRITHNNQNTLDCSQLLIVVKPNAHLTKKFLQDNASNLVPSQMTATSTGEAVQITPGVTGLNGKTVNDKSVTQTKYRQLEITNSAFSQDLMDALADSKFVNNVLRMEKEINLTRMKKLEAVV